jgi:hypothetical protein
MQKQVVPVESLDCERLNEQVGGKNYRLPKKRILFPSLDTEDMKRFPLCCAPKQGYSPTRQIRGSVASLLCPTLVIHFQVS